jgi:hypothetical protein
MSRRLRWPAIALAAAFMTNETAAQTVAAVPGANVPRRIAGSVFDSVARQPLRGAHVHLADLGRDTLSDSLGMFRFDSVGTGVHTIWVDHPMLDSLGLFSLGAKVDATPREATTIALAIPAFATLWKHACGSGSEPAEDSAFVFGRVRAGASTNSIFGATVAVAWRDISPDSLGARGKVMRRVAQTDSSGSYAICSVPAGRAMSVSLADSVSSAVLAVFRMGASRMARRDLSFPSDGAMDELASDSAIAAPSQPLNGAALTGAVRDSAGHALAGARIAVSGVAGSWQTNAEGRFLVQGIPAGTHVVTVSTVGFVHERRMFDAMARDSVLVDLSMSRLLTKLATVTVAERQRYNALKFDLDQRRRAGFGYRADSNELARLPGVMEAFNFPSVHTSWHQGRWSIYIQRGIYSMPSKNSTGGPSLSCNPSIWIDGMTSKGEIDILNEMSKEEIGLIEVFPSAAGAPLQFAGTATNCGVVLVWRKSFINP